MQYVTRASVTCRCAHCSVVLVYLLRCLTVSQGPPDWHPAPAAVKEAASKAAKHAQARGTDLAKLAITEFVRCGIVMALHVCTM